MSEGIDIREPSAVTTAGLLTDTDGALITTGTANVMLLEIQSDGSLKTFDFNDNTFKSTTVTTRVSAATHRQANNGAVNTGIWSHVQSTVSGFTAGNRYIEVIEHTSLVTSIMRLFQWGNKSTSFNLFSNVSQTGLAAAKYAGPAGPGVYYDDGAANTNTVIGTDGTSANAVSTLAAATTLATSLGVNRIYITGQSTLTLTGQTLTDYDIIGVKTADAASVNLGTAASPSILTRVKIVNCRVYGTHDVSDRLTIECGFIDDAPAAETTFLNVVARCCGFLNDFSLDTSSDNLFEACFSAIPGNDYPTVTCTGSAGTFVMRHYSGGIGVQNLSASHTASIEGMGQVVFESGCNVNAVIAIRGAFTLVDNTAGMSNITEGARIDTTQILNAVTNDGVKLDGSAVNQATADITSLESRLTAARAEYLDNLNVGGQVASNADIVAINQSASRRILLTTVGQYERPESSSVTYTIEARTYDGDGADVNADSSPTLTVTGSVSGDLSANLSGVTSPATGVYRWTYTVTSGATIEQVAIGVSATISGSTFTLNQYTQVTDFVAATFTTADRVLLQNASDKADIVAGSDGATLATSQPNYTPATAAAVSAIGTNVTTLVNRIGAFTGTGVNTVLGFLKAMMSKVATNPSDVGGTFTAADDSLEAVRDRGDSQWSGGGGGGGEPGGVDVTVNVKDQDSNPIADALVWITSDADGDTIVDGAYRSNVSGNVTFTLLSGNTYYLWAMKAGQQAIRGTSFTAVAD